MTTPKHGRSSPSEAPTESLVEKLEHTVEHAVERVDQAVEEAVEHVPAPIRRPVRWTIHQLAMGIVLSAIGVALVLVFGGAYYLWNHTEWAAHELSGRINQTLVSRSDVMLKVKRVKGNPLGTVDVISPQVRFRDGPVLLEARSMRLRYSTWELFTGRRGAIQIELDRPVVHLRRGADGRLRYPIWRPGLARRPGRGFDFALRIRKGDIRIDGSREGVDDFDLDASAATGGATWVDIRSLAWRRGPHGLGLQRFAGSVSVTDTVRLEVRELKSSDLELRGRALWPRDAGEREVEAEIRRVRWAWLARVFRNAALDVPGEGSFRVRAWGGPAWRGSFRSRAVWADVPLETRGGFRWEQGRLTLAPLLGNSAAGALDGELTWSRRGWELGGRATGVDPARWSVIGIPGWPAGRLNGSFRYRLDSRDHNHARLTAALGGAEWSGWRTDSAAVAVDFRPVGADSFTVHAFRRGGDFTLVGAAEGGSWRGAYTVARFPLDEWPDGRATGIRGSLVSGAGTVHGRGGALEVTGTLSGAATSWLGAQSARWTLSQVEGRLLPVPDLTARARLEQVFFLGIHFDSLVTPFHLGDRSLDFPTLEAWAGDTVLALGGRSGWSEHGWSFGADRAAARSSQFHWVASPPIRLSGDSRGVTFERLVASDGAARLEISGRWAGPRGGYDWRARAEDLELSRIGMPVEWKLAGRADAELRVTGAAGDPRWEFRAACRAPSFQDHRADSLALSLGGGPSRLEVRGLTFELDGGTLRGSGRVEGTGRTWPDTLTGAGVARWLADAARWQGTWSASGLPVDRLGQLAPRAQGWKGRVSGTLELAGRPEHPELRLEAQARPLGWRSYTVDQVDVKADLRDQRLSVRELRMTRGDVTSTIVGAMPLQLALGRRPRVPEAPMSWRLDYPNGDLGLLALFVPQIGSAAGRFSIDAEVTGTPRQPALHGTARVRDGRLRLAGREEVLQDVTARLTLGETRVTLDTLTAVQRNRQGETGRVAARGVVNLRGAGPAGYAFDLSMRDVTAVEPDLYAARFDGDFKVTDGPKIGGHTVPHVTSDNVEIRRAVILYDFTRQSEVQQVAASTQPLFWTYKLQIHANDNLHWRPSDGDIEFSADLSFEQTPEQLLIFGDMEALRGTYYFLSNRFAVQRAALTFDNVGGVDPLVDAEATTRLVPSQTLDSPTGPPVRPQPQTITVRIQGRSSRPTVEFASEPDALDEAQILRELTVGRFVQGQTLALKDPADSYLTQAINRQLSSELSKAFRGYLTEWEIARQSGGLLGQGGVILGVGSQLNSQLAVRYHQLLPGTGNAALAGTDVSPIERDIEAEYRLSRFLYVTSQLTQKRPTTGSTTNSSTPDFNVSLKARWEY